MLLIGLRGVTTEEDFEQFFVLGMRAWAGRSEDELDRARRAAVRAGHRRARSTRRRGGWWRRTARAGHTVVLASSATRFQVEPAARAMGVEHVLVTPVEIENGICTGRPGGPPLWRAGKAAAVRAFAAGSTTSTWSQSYAYSNGDEDVPFLAHRRPGAGAEPGRGAAAEAARQGLADRPVPPTRPAGGRARWPAPSAGVGGTLGGFGAGLALGALNGSPAATAVDLGHHARR